MYKVIINTRKVRKVITSPLRIVLSEKDSPTLNNTINNSNEVLFTIDVEGSVYLYKLYRNQGSQLLNEQLPEELGSGALELKTQILMLSNITKPLLAIILKYLEQRTQNIELLELVADPNCKHQLLTVLIYFKTVLFSEEVYHMLIDTYHLFVLYIQEVYVLDKLEHAEVEKELLYFINKFEYEPNKEECSTGSKLYKQNYIQLPMCLACLVKLERQVSGLPKSITSNKLLLPEQNMCSTCHVIDSHPADLQCYHCHETKDKWICMVCSYIGCGRYSKADAFKHFLSSGHIITMDLQTERIWNYHSDCFSHRLIPLQKQESTLKFPDYSGKKANQLYQESVQSAFWEYCSLVSEQLERQRVFYENEKAKQEDKFEKQSVKTEKVILDLEKQLDHKSQEVKKLSKKNKKLSKRLAQLKEKCKDDRELLISYDNIINQNTKEPTLAEIDGSNPKIQQKLKIIQQLDEQIEQTLIKLTQ